MEPYERIQGGIGTSPIVFSCEHASNALPVGWGDDAWLSDLHWAVDLGIAEFTRTLAGALGARGVLAGFSRLWIDANRPQYSTTLFRDEAAGRPVLMNVGLPDAVRLERIQACWEPFHDAVDEMIRENPAKLLLSMHSFTREYEEGKKREVDIGVLFDDEDELGIQLAELLRPSGYTVRLNEPYSGKGGMMFSCYKHAKDHEIAGIELEICQDLLADPVHVARILAAVEHAARSATDTMQVRV